uniref:Secreted protein n=1 Tax=Panagrellus redivivus TaxID=6233 RepID=A0A7E4VSJ5_PANRE
MGRSSVLCIFCVLFVAINVCTQDMSYSDAIKKYVTDCAKNTPTDGRMTVSYFTKDALFKTMDSVYVKQFDTKKQLRRYSPSEVLMQAACICTEVAMNSYEIIVSPMITQENKVDALTLCAFHDRSTDLGAVMDFPINFLNSWLHAQFWAQMPRTLFAPVGSIPAVSCIGNDGHPTQLVPGQMHATT